MTNTFTVLFCQGCNEKFSVSVADQSCPQCGQTLGAINEAPTQEFVDLAARGTYVGTSVASQGQDDELVGRRIGTYTIEAFVGKGGMARVYRARHELLERSCAIKVLNRQLVERDAEYVRMFFEEARAAASLVHPHVVTIHTIGHDEGLHYIEMEYVPGQSLHRFVAAQNRLDETLATQFMVQICGALAEAHRHDMIHRDIKPANVLVNQSATAKLADFGLAKRVVTSSALGTTRKMAGTPYYMAPELFLGAAADKQTDVYAMGVSYYFLLTGRVPFASSSIPDLAQMHRHNSVPRVGSPLAPTTATCDTVLQRCLAKEPADRYADACELLDELKAVYGGLRPLQSLVDQALRPVTGREPTESAPALIWQGAGDRFDVTVRFSNGRSQRVAITACTTGEIVNRIVKIYSVCGSADPNYYQRALELNAMIPHGSIAIDEIDGRPHFIIGNTYPRSTCDPEEIRQSVLSIARHADEIEHFLSATDTF